MPQRAGEGLPTRGGRRGLCPRQRNRSHPRESHARGTYLLTYLLLPYFISLHTSLASFLPSFPPTYFTYLPQRMTVESLIPAVGCLDRLCRSDENVDLIKNAGGIDTLLGVLDFCGDNETFTAEVISLIFHFII